jgi:transmembrane E3 ubiquitin-protein ligase
MIAPPPTDQDVWDTPTIAILPNSPEAAVWHERERRQRTIRLLMMFLVMLLLMDDKDTADRRKRSALQSLKKKNGELSGGTLEETVFKSRRVQEFKIREIVKKHSRFEALILKNKGENVDERVNEWAENLAEQEKDLFPQETGIVSEQPLDPEENNKVFHYPWNSTGFYRGEWTRKENVTTLDESPSSTKDRSLAPNKSIQVTIEPMGAVSLEPKLLKLLQDRHEPLGVVILPDGLEIKMRNDNNLTSMKWEDLRTDSNNIIVRPEIGILPDGLVNGETKKDDEASPRITLSHQSGRAAFQLFSRSIPCMKEISLVDGFVKLYDSTSPGFSTKRDILIRVRGVLIHSIGRLSLVSNVDVARSAFVIGGTSADDLHQRRRRLMVAIQDLKDPPDMENVRNEALALFSSQAGTRFSTFSAPDHENVQQEHAEKEAMDERRALETTELPSSKGQTTVSVPLMSDAQAADELMPAWSDVVLPYPFVRDDTRETVRRTKTPAARQMPIREKDLEANAAGCGFEVNMDVGEEEWTVGAWRKLVSRKVYDVKRLDPLNQRGDSYDYSEGDTSIMQLRRGRSKQMQEQALVVTMVGTIHSPNCGFTAFLNATALRTDWETTTSRAINYSFVMMLVCLVQIIILLRQLLHSQGQSGATRVSLLCIGWQTLIDALLCLAHIYMSLSISQLFSAFASVSFFKLLIFCVIEMKYMAMIIQARNSSNGGQTAEVLRRQIAMLHLRFYCAMAGSFMLFFYVGATYRIFYILALYSFWVPQIVLNIVTEAKSPMHTHYIYGMSLTRLVSPLYLFGVRNNFLREVYPEAPYDQSLCQMLVLWVGLQTVVLLCQGKYGARFLIPGRFLPPKFDYSRPIPASLLPVGVLDMPLEQADDREDALRSSSEERESLVVSSESLFPSRHTTAVTTRNRWKNRTCRENGMVKTDEQNHGVSPTASISPVASFVHHTLECSICYEPIDVRKRHDYMLAPCNHLFHRECLVQWMDVKMECPICRTSLPAV